MPREFFGPFGAQDDTFANAGNANLGRFPLGEVLILPDGRVYKFALNDATAEVAGSLYQSVAPVAGHTNRLADVVRAIGAVAVSATLATTAAADDIYAEGTVHTNDEVGEGYTYRVRRANTIEAAHADAVATGVLTVNLAAGESIQVALTTASEMSFTRNRYHAVLIHASPPTAGLAGVSPGVAAADRFYWSQVKGYAAVLASGTLLAGLPVMAGVTTDGSVESSKRRVGTAGTTALVSTAAHAVLFLLDQDGTTTAYAIVTTTTGTTVTRDVTSGIADNAPNVGVCVKANASTELALIDLAIR